ncbi:YgaP family membrane protein [Yoonia sp. TsM2_T14_4]|uniref:YgaP family membrane protein n=1 Tax=Yoonia sp. TsM2_T14_4 TaxID=3415141 RepID=UPI003C72BA46
MWRGITADHWVCDNITDTGGAIALDLWQLEQGAFEMTVNVGDIDRMIRGTLGIVLLALPFIGGVAVFDSLLATILSVVVGLVMLGVAATRSCPLYTVLGMRTCKV